MKLWVCATPIGNLGDMTLRAQEILKNCDAVLAEDTRVTQKLLFSFCDTKKPIFSCHKFNETGVSENLENLFSKFESIVLVSDAGTPAISDPGSIVVSKARELGAEIRALPGASAVIAAMSLSGLTNKEFAFVGFLDRDSGKQKKMFEKMSDNFVKVFVFYESPNRIIKTLENLDGEKVEQVYAYNDLTKIFEKHYVGSLEKVIDELTENEKSDKGEYVVIVVFKEKIETEKQYSLEAELVNEMITKNCDTKTAVATLTEKGFNKNELYKASLSLKDTLNKNKQ